MTATTWLKRVAVAAGVGPAWARRAYQDEVNMRLLLAFSLAADSNCIDVGSHDGRFLSEMVRIAPLGRHVAYEPLPPFFAKLTTDFPGVDVRRAALSNVNGTSDFTYVKNLPAYSGFRRRKYPSQPTIETITVQTERLDDRLPSDYIPALIKIDVEGAEQLVIEGAMETLKRHRPIVLFEHGIGASDFYGTGPSDIYRLLCDSAGLRIFDLDGSGPYSLPQLETVYRRNDRWNFVAHR
jgi:FkbM family methyltransferase